MTKYSGTTKPSAARKGDEWIDTTTNILYTWDGHEWVVNEIQNEAADNDAYDRAMKGI